MIRTPEELSERFAEAYERRGRLLDERTNATEALYAARAALNIAAETVGPDEATVRSHQELVDQAETDLRARIAAVERAENDVEALRMQLECTKLALTTGGGTH